MTKKRNFDLIEILVVISIVAIIAAMVLPALKNARDKAKYQEGEIPTQRQIDKATTELLEAEPKLKKSYKVYNLDGKITEEEFKKLFREFVEYNDKFSYERHYPFKRDRKKGDDWLK